jgi:hypothetical protein
MRTRKIRPNCPKVPQLDIIMPTNTIVLIAWQSKPELLRSEKARRAGAGANIPYLFALFGFMFGASDARGFLQSS